MLRPGADALRPAVRALDAGQRGGEPVRARGDAAAARATSARSCARRARWCATCARPRRDLAAATPDLDAHVRGAQPPLQHARLQPGRPRGPGRAPTREEGYLFWLAWVQHKGIQLFSQRRRARRRSARSRSAAPCATIEQIVDERARARVPPGCSRPRSSPTPRRARRDAGSELTDAEDRPRRSAACSRWSSSRCRASGCCCSCGSSFGGAGAAQAGGLPLPGRVPRGDQLGREADVRVAGVTVGKVRAKELDPTRQPHAGDDRARPRASRRSPRDARRSCARRRCWARPTSSSTPGTDARRKLPEGGRLADARSSRRGRSSTRSSRRSTRETREAFRTWQQDLARGRRRAAAATSTTRSATCRLRARRRRPARRARHRSEGAVRRLVTNTGVVFGALTENEAQLRSLITDVGARLRGDRVAERRARRDVPDLPDVPRRVARRRSRG